MFSFITKSKSIDRDSYLWNAVSGMLNSVQAPILLLLVARGKDGLSDSAVLVIAYAIGNLMMTIGKYGVRNYQVTDVSDEHSFGDYLNARKISVLLMIVASIIYILYCQYDVDKTVVVLAICCFKLFDSIEDVYHGELQKIGRLDVAGKILTFRFAIYFSLFFVIYIITQNLMVTSMFAVLISVFFGTILDIIAWKNLKLEKGIIKKDSVTSIIRECFPLFLCTFLIMYVGNAPKYTVDKYYGVDVQGAFNYVFMPVFVIALFGNFIFQPMQRKASLIYKEKKYKAFYSLILKGGIAVVLITAFITLCAAFMGIPILSFVFNHKLEGYKFELILLLLSGGALALVNMLNIFISLIRCQKSMIISYCLITLITKVLGDYIAMHYPVRYLVISYCLIMFLLVVCLMVVLIHGIKNNKAKRDI